MLKTVAVMVILMMGVTSGLALAASPWTEEDNYGEKSAAKLSFGMKNLLGAWTELVSKPMDYHRDGKNIPAGALHGLKNAAIFGVGGLLHVATFPVTNLDVPLPDNGVQFE